MTETQKTTHYSFSPGFVLDKEAAVQKPSQEEPGDADISSDLKDEEFTDEKHESEFSLETNFIEEESSDQKENCSSTGVAKGNSASMLEVVCKHHSLRLTKSPI